MYGLDLLNAGMTGSGLVRRMGACVFVCFVFRRRESGLIPRQRNLKMYNVMFSSV